MDFAKFDTKTLADQGVEFHPTPPGFLEPVTDVVFRVVGIDSSAFQKRATARAREDIEAARKRGKRFLRVSEEEIERIRKRRVEDVAECVLGWDGVAEHGAAVEYSREAACKLLFDYPWLLEQLDEFIAERANFLSSAGTSGS